jgi:hypothetical protein
MKYDAYGTAEAVPFQIKCNSKPKSSATPNQNQVQHQTQNQVQH